MSEQIILTNSEIMLGAQLGIMRQLQNIAKSRRPAYGATSENEWQINIEGALGEMAVAKYLGWYWSGALGNLGAADVRGIEVRTTHHKNGRLIVHPRDSDDAIFILAIGRVGKYNLMGWLPAYEAKKDEYWKDPTGNGRAAFFVSVDHLIEMRDLSVALSLRGLQV